MFGVSSAHDSEDIRGTKAQFRLGAREDIEEPFGKQRMFKCSGCRHLLTQEPSEFP